MSLQAAQPSQKLLDLLNASLRRANPFEFDGDLAAASSVVTNIADTGPIVVGDKIYLTIVDASAPLTVLSKTATTITLSAVAGTTQAGQPLVAVGATVLDITAYKVGLFTGTPTRTLATVLADLTQPTYTGYALVTVPMEALRQDTLGNLIDPLNEADFQPTDAVGLPQTVTGVMLLGTIGGTDFLLLSEELDAAWIFLSALSGFSTKLDLYIRNLPAYGGICSVC